MSHNIRLTVAIAALLMSAAYALPLWRISLIAPQYPEGLGMLIISTDNNCQGFKIEVHGDTPRRNTEISGLWLVAEEWVEEENQPF